MFYRWHPVASVPAGLLFAALVYGQFTYQAQHEDMEAQLTVEVGKQTTERGLGEVTLTLTVKGPPDLDVEEPRLGDAAAAWKDERVTTTREIKGQRAVWSQVIRLKQVKRGIEPLPDVTVRFRRGPDADWIEENWIDILRNIQDRTETPPPEKEAPSWLRRWGFELILAATALLVLLAWLRKRRRVHPSAALPPEQWALKEIDSIERTLMPPQGKAEAYHTRISFVVRRYLAERFGLHALQQTTVEFLDAICQVPQLPAEEQALLTELFERCDLAKFARAGTSPDECQRTAEMARHLVRQTTK